MELLLFLVAAIYVTYLFKVKRKQKNKRVTEEEQIAKKHYEKSIKEKRKEPIQRINLSVVGINYQNRNKALKKVIEELKRNDGFRYHEPYEGMSNKEIIENGFPVYELSFGSFPDTRIVKENDNKYDKNALMVFIADHKEFYYHIGYIPKEHNVEIREMMDKYRTLIGSSVTGGKYKDIDYDVYDKEKTRIYNSDYGVDLSVSFWERSESDIENTATTMPEKIATSYTKSEDYLKYTKARKLTEDYTVIDFETTSLTYKTNKIIQIAAVKYKNHEKVNEFTTNVNPQVSLSSRIKSITGLTDNELKNAPLIQDVLPELLEFISGETLVAHNAPFDMKFLLYNIHQHNHTYKKYRIIDTLTLARKYIAIENHKLVTLKDYLLLNHYDSHNALHDCYVTAKVYKYCFESSFAESI